jgi:hypothetical protein
MLTSDFAQLHAMRQSGWEGLTYYVDELRYGLEIGDVTPVAQTGAPIPEPMTMALAGLALGGVGTYARRRRRRRTHAGSEKKGRRGIMQRTLTLAVVLAAAMLAAGPVSAATIPASWDFGSDSGKDDASDFTKSSVRWSLEADALRGKGGTSNLSTSATVQLTNLGTTVTDLRVDANATPTSFRYWDKFGLLALGGSSGNNGIAGILYRNGDSGTPQIELRDGGTSGTVLDGADWTGDKSGNFALELDAVPDGTGIWDLTFTVTDASAHSQTVSVDDYAFSAGQWTGMALHGRDIRPVDYWDFSVSEVPAGTAAIPEPVTMALAGLALGGVATYARRRRRQHS